MNIFTDIFGNNSTSRVIDYFLDGYEMDFNISDIAKALNIQRPTVYKAIESLLKNHIIIKSRKVGNITLYKLNKEDPKSRKLQELSNIVIKQQKELIRTQPKSMPS